MVVRNLLGKALRAWTWAAALGASFSLSCGSSPAPRRTNPDTRGLPILLPKEAEHPAPKRTTPSLTGLDTGRASHAEGTANYVMAARLDARTHHIVGKGRISFSNPSPKPANELFFHLYLNAFEGPDTLFQRNNGGRSGLLGGRPGSIRILSLTSPRFGKLNLWDRADAHSPGDPHDRTDIRVPLPTPLPGGEAIELDVEFESRLPEVVERTGFAGDFHLIAQWYPKLAKRERNGSWAHFPFHAYGEFYADFGDYDVTLDVPRHFVVGSTGNLKRLPDSEPNRARYRARASHVHDFAWTAWPQFREQKRVVSGVDVRLLHLPHGDQRQESTWRTLIHGFSHLQRAYGEYPYEQLTVVQPPAAANATGAMEYPQFITTNSNQWWPALGLRSKENVTIHELSHQWFQGILASNEMAHPFLDEGLASYATWRYLEQRYGTGSYIDGWNVRISETASTRYSTLRGWFDQPIDLPAASFRSFGRLSSIVYGRAQLALMTLRRVYGPSLDVALGNYARAFRFGHPEPDDFYRALEETLGSEARNQVELMFRERATLDLSVKDISTRRADQGLVSVVTLARQGRLWFPFLVRARFADGSTKEKKFEQEQSALRWKLVHDAPIVSVVIDPEHRILWDENLLNNRKLLPSSPGRAPARPRLTTRVVSVLAFLLSALGA